LAENKIYVFFVFFFIEMQYIWHVFATLHVGSRITFATALRRCCLPSRL